VVRSESQKDFDLGNLCIAAARARLVLQRQRQVMVEMVRDYAGPYWGAEWQAGYQTQPINILGLYTSITLRGLISKNPRVMLSTFVPQAKPVVAAMEEWFNNHVEKINFSKTLRRIFLDMMFVMGIAKVGITNPMDSIMSGRVLKAGEPFVDRIDLDDYVYDIHARDISESWQGHRFRVPLDLAKKFFGKKAADLEASDDRLFNAEGDERINVLGRGMYGDNDEYRPMVDLWEIYLPWEGLVVTLRDECLGGPSAGVASAKMGEYKARALKQQRWLGPPRGPYHTKSFITINGNAMGKGPLQDIWDMHGSVNNLARKLIEQGRRQKQVLMVRGGADADGNRVIKTNDGEATRVDNPQDINQVEFGGPNNQIFVLMNDLIQRASWVGGNLEVRGGLSPQGKTATQENILNSNSQGVDVDMQATAVDFTAEICESLLWFHHHHPENRMLAPWAPKGLPEMAVTRVVGPEHRVQVPWEQLHLKVDPYSMTHQTPQQRMASLMQVLQTVLVPLAPVAAQAGRQLDFDTLLAKIGKYLDDPDFEEIMSGQAPPPQEQQPNADLAQPGGNKTTTHVRENMPGRTQQGDQLNLRNALMGVNPGGASSNGKHSMAGA
jgi:hypothetical protein